VDPWLRQSTRFAALLAASGTLFLMLATVADVARRQLTGQPLTGVVEISEVMLVAVVFLGVAYTQREKQHVATTVLTDRLPPRVSGWLRVIGTVVVVVLLLWMIQATSELALESYRRGEYRFGLTRVPLWPARASIPLGLTLLLGEVVRDLLARWRALRRCDVEAGAPPGAAAGTNPTTGLPE
jgi:TRAP-type C4-dicarboxylate transport system permease small subunit